MNPLIKSQITVGKGVSDSRFFREILQPIWTADIGRRRMRQRFHQRLPSPRISAAHCSIAACISGDGRDSPRSQRPTVRFSTPTAAARALLLTRPYSHLSWISRETANRTRDQLPRSACRRLPAGQLLPHFRNFLEIVQAGQ